jgi:dCTP deaminase
MARLTGAAIREQIDLGNIVIDPFVHENVTETGVDLRLGTQVAQYTPDVVLDPKKPGTFEGWVATMSEEHGFRIEPGKFYLMHTMERVMAKNFDPIVNGKSSVGRCSVQVHMTAGFGEPGFDGQYTLEVTTQIPMIVYPGMLFCQIRFDTLEGKVSDYKKRGNYTGVNASGPVFSKIWKQYVKEQ